MGGTHVISLLTMLLASMSDTTDAAAARARSHELRGRLGLGRQAASSDLASRLRWAIGWLSEHAPPNASRLRQALGKDSLADGLASHVYPEDAVVDLVFTVWAVTGYYPRGGRPYQQLEDPADEANHLMDLEGEFLESLAVGVIELPRHLPEHGLQTRFDPLIPWLADQIRRTDTTRAETEHFPLELLASLQEIHPLYHPGSLDDLQNDVAMRLTRIADWWEATSPDLMSMTFAEAEAASDAWHGELALRPEFRFPISDGKIVARGPDGYTVHKLVTKRQLADEGTAMGHCVGGYWPNVRDGASVIFSVRDAEGVPWVTLEVKPSRSPYRSTTLTQAMGPEDVPHPTSHVSARAWDVATAFIAALVDADVLQATPMINYLRARLGLPRVIHPQQVDDARARHLSDYFAIIRGRHGVSGGPVYLVRHEGRLDGRAIADWGAIIAKIRHLPHGFLLLGTRGPIHIEPATDDDYKQLILDKRWLDADVAPWWAPLRHVEGHGVDLFEALTDAGLITVHDPRLEEYPEVTADLCADVLKVIPVDLVQPAAEIAGQAE